MFQVTIIVFIVLGTVAAELETPRTVTDFITKIKLYTIKDKVEPEAFNVRFLLYTSLNQNNETFVIKAPSATISSDIGKSTLNSSLPTKIIVHGYMSHYSKCEWCNKMRDEYLKFTKCNVMLVDWSEGSNGTYAQAYANTRTAANAITNFINNLKNVMGLSLSDVHIIGSSLGAHTSGFVGHSFAGQIGRITGLDPAYPGFAGPGIDKLNQTSAQFVDVIHSDVYVKDAKYIQAGFGIAENLGHIDFWPNNGVCNANCITPCMRDHFKNNAASVDNLSLCASCSHVMAANYYADSINPQNLNGTAHQNEKYALYKEGVCNGISVESDFTCAIIGELAILSKPHKNDTTGKSYYLNTNSKSPYFRG